MVKQRQINIIFRVGAGDMSDGFGPRQRRTFLLAEMVAHSQTCQRVKFGLRNACFAQRLTVHFQAKCAAVDLRDPQVNQFRQLRFQRAIFQRFAGLNQSVIDFRTEFIIGLA